MNSPAILLALLPLLLIMEVLSFPHEVQETGIASGEATRRLPSSREGPEKMTVAGEQPRSNLFSQAPREKETVSNKINQSGHSLQASQENWEVSGETPRRNLASLASQENLAVSGEETQRNLTSQEIPGKIASREASQRNLSSLESPKNGVTFGEATPSNLSSQEADNGPQVIKELQLLDELSIEESEHVTSDYAGEENDEVDAFGCNLSLKTKLEHRCDFMYDKASTEAELIEEPHLKTEATCCSLEDYEKCNLQAYDKANCGKLKAAARENIKATHLFISMLSNISCTEFRGQCLFYPSSASTLLPASGFIMVALILLVL